ncbi:MAG: LysM peptidoglycan-binding domain-containing protein [Archangium sp.]|nr:LysM peptidoglycan-binding domain-containing protein [Archangium sp.]
MRHLLLTASLTLLTFAPAGAFAQEDQEDTGDEESVAPEGSSTIAPEKKARAPSSTGKASSPGTQHTVEKGDTLWDLSQKFLGSPWYWPKVWSYNPEIANPHWIYPGNEVRFFSSGEEVPTQVEVGQPETEVEEGEMFGDKVTVFGQIGFRPKNALSVASPGFVTNREVEESGTLFGSFAESAMLSYADRIYVRFGKKAPRMGETYLVFRRAGEVIHPVTRDPIGYMTEVLAEVKVIRIDKDNSATVMISKQYDEVARGDLVGPLNEPVVRAVAPRPNERDVKDAFVVADVRRYPTMLGENSLAIMDKGSDDGVKMGNVFTIYRQHDPLPQDALMQPTVLDEQYPIEDIGQCVAFEVKAKVTMCLVTQSIREFVLGDHAEIRASGSRRAGR